MSYRFLWYPTLNVPNNDWLRSVLLYSDSIGTIVPWSVQRRRMDPHIEFLHDIGELEYVSPDPWLHDIRVEGFEEEVFDLFQSADFRRWRAQRYRPKGTYRGQGYEPPRQMNLSEDKLSYLLRDLLTEARLLTDSGETGWFTVDEDVAVSYMALLAKYLAGHLNYVPSTDRSTFERLIFNVAGRDAAHPVGALLLSKVLPTPAPFTLLEDIVHFKRHRHEELLRFRKLLDGVHDKLANAHSPEEKRDILAAFENEVQLGVTELQRLMAESRVSFRLTSLKTLFEAKTPDILGGLLVGTAGAGWTASGIGAKLTGAAAGAAITLSYSWVRARIERTQQLKTSPFSYVFQARQVFGSQWQGHR